MRNAIYLPAASGLVRATGRTPFGSVLSTATPSGVIGIRDAQFDNGVHVLIAHASSFYATALVGDTGTFASAQAVTQGRSLDAVQWDNQYYLLNGTASDLTDTSLTDQNFVMYMAATATATNPSWRLHGVLPVTQSLAASATAGTFSVNITGYYEYWSTEVVEYTKDGVTQRLEGTFTGTPANFLVAVTGSAVAITRPGIVNTGATRWEIYRSPALATPADKSFPVGFLIADLPIGTTSFVDGLGTGGGYVFGSASATSFAQFNHPDFGAGWANTGNIFADDGSVATVTAAQRSTVLSPLFAPLASLYIKSFTGLAATVTEPVTGVEVAVKGKLDANPQGIMRIQLMRLSPTAGIGYAMGVKVIPLLNGTTSVFIMGGNGDVWGAGTPNDDAKTNPVGYGPRWSAADFNDGNFAVHIDVSNGFSGGATTMELDSVKVKVYSGGTAVAGSTETPVDTPFPAIIIDQSGLQTSVGRNGKPPVASTGDIFNDQLVLNDVTQPSFIRYSESLEPDHFPSIYFLDFETSDNDIVTNIKTLNNRLGVFLRTALYRVNYLPDENDATFDRGRAFEQVSPNYGCYNSQCACRYTNGMGRTELAYVSDHGIHSTDLASVRNISDDLDWRSIVATANSYPIALVNDPDRWELLFYYYNASVTDTEYYRCIHLSYHPSHIRDSTYTSPSGRPKVSGQVHMRNYDTGLGVYADLTSAWVVKRQDSGTTSVYLGYGGSTASATAAGAGVVYRENGATIPAHDPNMSFTTRRMYLNGFGKEFRLNEMYAYVPSAGGTPTVEYSPYTLKTNDTHGEVQQPPKSFTYNQTVLHKVQFNQQAEGLRIHMTQTANPNDMRYEFLILDGEDFGSEDSGA